MFELGVICGGRGCSIGDGIAVLGIAVGVAAVFFAMVWKQR